MIFAEMNSPYPWSAVVSAPLSQGQAKQIYREHNVSWDGGQEGTTKALGLAIITETVPPDVPYGHSLVDSYTLQPDLSVLQVWTTVPDELAGVKAEAHAQAKRMITNELDNMAEQKGIGRLLLETMRFVDREAQARDGLTSGDDHALLDSFRQTQGIPAGQVAAAVDTRRNNYYRRGRTLEVAEHDCHVAIDAATDIAGVEAAIAALEAEIA